MTTPNEPAGTGEPLVEEELTEDDLKGADIHRDNLGGGQAGEPDEDPE